MRAGAEGHSRVQRDDRAVRFVRFPARHHSQPCADIHSVVVCLPARLPVLLAHTRVFHPVRHLGALQAVPHQLSDLRKILVRRNVQVHRYLIPAFIQQFLLNEVNVSNGLHLGLQIPVILDVDAAARDARGNGLRCFGPNRRHRRLDVCPFHSFLLPALGAPAICHNLLSSSFVRMHKRALLNL